MINSFDIFLSHNSKDKPAVRELAEALRARGLRVWLDEWELVPGHPWQEALEEIIETTRSSAVLVGKDGLGPWQDAEMRGCLSEFVDRKLPVIPVLLPGAPDTPQLPFFLRRFTWVDLRGGLTDEGLDRLEWGATGKRPDHLFLTAAPEATAAAAEPTFAEVPAPEIKAPVVVAKERPDQKVRELWGVSAWIGLLTLLGIAVFLSDRYFLAPDKPGEAQRHTISSPTSPPQSEGSQVKEQQVSGVKVGSPAGGSPRSSLPSKTLPKRRAALEALSHSEIKDESTPSPAPSAGAADHSSFINEVSSKEAGEGRLSALLPKHNTREDVIKLLAYKPTDGYVLKIISITLPESVRRGTTFKSSVVYAAIGPNANEVFRVMQYRSVKSGGDYVLGVPSHFDVPAGGAVVESSLDITIPKTAPAGQYRLDILLESTANHLKTMGGRDFLIE